MYSVIARGRGRLFVNFSRSLRNLAVKENICIAILDVAENWPLLKSWSSALTILHLQAVCDLKGSGAGESEEASQDGHEYTRRPYRLVWYVVKLGGRAGGQKPFPFTVAKQRQQPPSLGITYEGWGDLLLWGFCAFIEKRKKGDKIVKECRCFMELWTTAVTKSGLKQMRMRCCLVHIVVTAKDNSQLQVLYWRIWITVLKSSIYMRN